MFGYETSQLAVAAMAMLCAGGVAWVFVYPYLSGEARAEKRLKGIRKAGAPTAVRRNEQLEAEKRRKQIQESLSEVESRHKQRSRPPLRARIQQAGLRWSLHTYFIVSAAMAVLAVLGGFLADLPLIMLPALAISGGLGLPHWLVNYLGKRRKRKFLNELPNAVDIIVRGVKAGLPLGDCLRIVAGESQEPVRSEFRSIIETQAIGLPLADCVERMYDRMPLAEVNFFAIVVAIQQRAGGNLSEALANLSRVLRDRKKMRAKIQAMSQEAKASAAIIGSLPAIIMILVFLTSPDYISLLWTEPLGHMMLAGSALWMLCGVLVMRKMINFDF